MDILGRSYMWITSGSKKVKWKKFLVTMLWLVFKFCIWLAKRVDWVFWTSITEQTHTISKMSNIHITLTHHPANKQQVMTPLSDERSLDEVHLQHQILHDSTQKSVLSWTDKRVLQSDFRKWKGYKLNSVEVLYPVTESSLTIFNL